METILLTREEVALRAKTLYQQNLQGVLETPENVGKMVIIDIESGDYEMDDEGIDSAKKLRSRHPNGRLFGIRVGYRTAEAIGGVLRRSSSNLTK